MSIKFAITTTPNPVKFAPLVYCGPTETTFRKAAEFGYDGVEIHLRDASDISVPDVKRLMKETGLAVTTLGTGLATVEYGINFASDDPLIRRRAVDYAKKLTEIASEIGSAVTIGLMNGKVGRGAERNDRIKWVLECLSECRAYAEKKGVIILLEAINRYESDYMCLQEDSASFAEKAGKKNMKILSDIFHMNIEEKDICASLEARKDEIGYVHLVDSNRQYPGQGHTDLKAVVSTLKKIGYSGYFSFECLPLPDSDTAAKNAIGNVKKLL